MKKLLGILAAVGITASGASSVTAMAPEHQTSVKAVNTFDTNGNIEFSGAKNDWDWSIADTGGSGDPTAGLNKDKNPDVMANATGGNNNNSYSHMVVKVDFKNYANSWNDFTNKYSKFAYTGSTTIWGDYERDWLDNHPINNALKHGDENKVSLLNTSDISSYGTNGWLNQKSVGNGSLPTIDTTGWNNWWLADGKKKIARSQAWGGSSAISIYHDDNNIYFNIAADFQNDFGTYTATGKSELTLTDLTFIKNA